MTKSRGPLEGVRILDLSRMLAGPFGAMLLADLGAEVIKIEQPGDGDMSRAFQAYNYQGESAYFLAVNRNKRSLALNLKASRGRQVFYDLVRVSDVVWDNFRPGVLDRLQIEYERLREVNPRIICCSVTGYGSAGPARDQPALDTIIQARGGAMSLTGEPARGRQPARYYRMGLPIGDLAGGIYGALGTVAALHARDRIGAGQRVDVSLIGGQISLLTYQAAYYLLSGKVPEPIGTGHTSVVPIGAYQAQDGPIIIECSSQRFWLNLCRALERPEWAVDPRFLDGEARLAHREQLDELINYVVGQRSVAEWLAVFAAEDVPAGPLNTLDRALSDPQVAALNLVVEVEHTLGGTVKLSGNPIKLSGTPAETFTSPPTLGEHSREILRGVLGYAEERVEGLMRAGVVQAR